jgi:peptidoglycan/LPS O-acetylase OafA/YrhL
MAISQDARQSPGRDVFHSLTGLRFVLAVWITLYHLTTMYGAPEVASHPLIAVGAARVDGFFLLSGFVLAHIYAVRTGGRFAYGPFLQARIARLYPLHLLALMMLAAVVLAANVIGRGQEAGAYTPLGFAANLVMLQAWGVPGAGQWNFPAWTLSAEFFAYLIFPLIVAAAAALARRPLVLLALALALVAAVEAAWALMGQGRLGEMTQHFGIVRGACGVIVGVAARYAFEKVAWPAPVAVGACLIGAVSAGAAAVVSAPLWTLHAGAVLLILGLASLDRAHVPTPLSTPLMQRLGEMSYALFILHVPSFIMVTQALSIAGWDGHLGVGVGTAILGTAIGAAAVANRLLEDPAREIIRGWRLFPKAALKTP